MSTSTLQYRRKCAAFIVMCDLIKKKEKRKRKAPRYWINHLYQYRNENGEHLLNILSLDESTGHFKNFVRISPQDFEILINVIGPLIQKMDTKFRKAVTVKEQLAVTLRFLATGDSYTSLQYLFKLSKQTISRIIPAVCNALIDVLKKHVKMPQIPEEWLSISADFEKLWNFPNCLGSIDGKHVMLQAPFNSGSEYYNYKGFPSIVLFAIVDANYNFIFADVGCQGRISDGGIFQNSEIHRKITTNSLNCPPPRPLPYKEKSVPYMFIGDEAFALSEYVMKPYSGIHSKGSKEWIFNYRLSRARRTVENAFGIISSVFRVLRKPMLLEPEKAQVVVMAIICLHNYLRNSSTSNNVYMPPGTLDAERDGSFIQGSWRTSDHFNNYLHNIQNIPRRASVNAKQIREEFASYFLTNGIIPWQYNEA